MEVIKHPTSYDCYPLPSCLSYTFVSHRVHLKLVLEAPLDAHATDHDGESITNKHWIM